MAILKESVIGVLSGKIGQVVGSTWKGISVLKVLPGSVAQPNTDKQLAQRAKFKTAQQFLQPITQFLRTGYRNYAIKMSGFNAAQREILKNAITGTYPNFAINYPAALVARGTLPGVLNPVAASTVAGTILFTWDDNSEETGASDTDPVLVVVYNAVKNWAVTLSNLADRGDGTLTVTVPDAFSGDQVHTYLAFNTLDGFTLSDSKYAGAVTVA